MSNIKKQLSIAEEKWETYFSGLIDFIKALCIKTK